MGSSPSTTTTKKLETPEKHLLIMIAGSSYHGTSLVNEIRNNFQESIWNNLTDKNPTLIQNHDDGVFCRYSSDHFVITIVPINHQIREDKSLDLTNLCGVISLFNLGIDSKSYDFTLCQELLERSCFENVVKVIANSYDFTMDPGYSPMTLTEIKHALRIDLIPEKQINVVDLHDTQDVITWAKKLLEL